MVETLPLRRLELMASRLGQSGTPPTLANNEQPSPSGRIR
jgi:hypothetical protein